VLSAVILTGGVVLVILVLVALAAAGVIRDLPIPTIYWS